MTGELLEAIVEIREEEALSLARSRLDAGADPVKLLEECREALVQVGERFGEGVYFLPELIMAGEIMQQISALAKPHLQAQFEVPRRGKIVFGTVEGDIHDIGKNIVAFMLDINGFEVIDLGVDVPPIAFVEKVKEEGASILGLSGFLHFANESMKKTIDLLHQEGLDEGVKVMIGGGQVTETVREYTGADGWGREASEAVRMALAWTGQEGEE